MNDTLDAISVQRLNRAVKSVVNAMPGSCSSSGVVTGLCHLDTLAKSPSLLTTPRVSSVSTSVIGLQPPQSFMLSLDMAGRPLVPGHPDRTIIPGFPMPDMQNFSALKPKRLTPYTGPMPLSQIMSGDRILPRLMPMPPRVLAPAVPPLSAVPPYHPSTAVLASSVPLGNLPPLSLPAVRFPSQPPSQTTPSHLQVLGKLPSSSYVTCFLPPPVAPPTSTKASAMTLTPTMTLPHTAHLQLLVPQHMNMLPPSGPLSPATTQLLQSAIEAESLDSSLPSYHDTETLAPMSSLLSMISHNADDTQRLSVSQDVSHDTDAGLHANFGDDHLLGGADMQCLQAAELDGTGMSPLQGGPDTLPSPPLPSPSPQASPDNPNSAQDVDVVTDDCDVTPSSLLDDDPVAHGNITMNALVEADDTVLPLVSVAATSLQTLAPPCGSQENQPTVTTVFDFLLQPKSMSMKTTGPCKVNQNTVIMRADNIPVYPDLDGAPTNKGRYCVDCNKMYREESGCPTHMTNYAVMADGHIPSRARLSVPPQLTLRAINNQTAPNFMGVIALEGVASHTLFGPLLGNKTTKEQLERPTETAYVWELFDDGRQCQVLDCRNEELSNWLMFVKRARTSAEQNVMVYQQQDDIYFVTCKDIDPGTELLYWYARDYAKMLGVAWRPEDFFKCPTCSKQFPDVNSVKQHVRYAHPDMTRRRCKCQLCGHAFTCASKLNTHMLSHMGVKPHKCQYCGKQFTDGSNLRMHLRLHTGERKFACKLCKRRFRQKAHLDMHQLTHTGEKRLQCLFCERMFARAADVKQHALMHTRERLYHCTHDGCAKTFWKKENFKRHLKVHSGVREFECAKCRKAFATSFHLKRHLGVCKGPKTAPHKELNATTGAELGLSIAKRRIQKRQNVKFKEADANWECPL